MSKHFNDNGRSGISVSVHNGDLEQAIQELNKKLKSDGIMKQLRDREYHKTNGQMKHARRKKE